MLIFDPRTSIVIVDLPELIVDVGKAFLLTHIKIVVFSFVLYISFCVLVSLYMPCTPVGI